MRVDLSALELHNLERTSDGYLRVRRAFVSNKTPTASTSFIAGFSLESPFTSEVWHYLFEQHQTTAATTLRVFTEEFAELFSWPLGVVQKAPVITWGQNTGQLLIHSPAFSAPLYGLPGGGVITAVKQDSINDDTTAIDIPRGHVASFGDRFVIAQGNVLYFNDPPGASNSYEVRTFVGLSNAIALPGAVYDLMQGPDGALYIFTSVGVFTLPSDATSQGQGVAGWLQRIPGIETSKPGNAVATNGGVAVLQRNSIVILPSGERIDIPRATGGRRQYAADVAIDDLRVAGRLFSTSTGFVVSFGTAKPFLIRVDLGQRSVTFVETSNPESYPLGVVGTLRSRDGETLYVLPSKVCAEFQRATTELSSPTLYGVAVGRVALPANAGPVVRRTSIQADALGKTAVVNVDAGSDTVTLPTHGLVIGTSTWAANAVLRGASLKSARASFAARTSEPNLEVVVSRGGTRILPAAEIETSGQGAVGRTDAP